MKHSVRPPTWRESSRRRVLMETSDWAEQDALTHLLTRAGYDVVCCSGPGGRGLECSLVAHGDCEGCEGADVVLHTLRQSDVRNRDVLLQIRKRYPDLPIVVEAPGPIVQRRPGDFAGCIVVQQPMTSDALLSAMEEAFGEVSAPS